MDPTPQGFAKRAATSPLTSEFDKKPKLCLTDEESKKLNNNQQYLEFPAWTDPGDVRINSLAISLQAVAINVSIMNDWMNMERCVDYIKQLSRQEQLDLASLWIQAHNTNEWTQFANYLINQVTPPTPPAQELVEELPHLVSLVQSEKVTLESWDVTYVGEADDLLYDHISTYSKDADNYARYTSIVQSSGMGKSRAIDELSKKHLVVPVNLRQHPDGFPPPDDEVRDWLLRSKTKTEAFTRASVFLCAMFVTLLCYLEGIDGRLAAIGVPSADFESLALAAKFRLLMTRGQTFSHQSPTRRQFYTDILRLADKIPRPSSPAEDDLKGALKRLLAFLIPDFDCMKTYPPALILSFDEAHALAKVEAKTETCPPWSRFYEFRRALRVIQSYPCFSVFLATTGKVNQFMPNPGESNRYQTKLLKLISPFCELGYDQLAEKVVSDKTTLDEVASLGFMASLSRPLFATRFMKGDEDIKRSIVNFAGEKLLCKPFPPSVSHLSDVEKTACISVRIPLEFNLRSRDMEQTLVERHLRVCLRVDPGFETAITIAPSEPLLAEASSFIMSDPAFDLPRCLQNLLEEQGLDKGNRGELIGMALCLSARDAAVKRLGNRVIPVSDFIQELVVSSEQILNSKPVRARTSDEAQGTFRDTFCHSNIFFNHFVKFRDRGVINRRYLWRLIARGAAGLCADFQFGVDIVIPFLFWDLRLRRINVSAFFIQCKNDASFQNTPREYLFDMMNPYHIQFFDSEETHHVPVVRMVFALASSAPDVVVLKCSERVQPTRDASFKAIFQGDKYTSFDIWCAKASYKTFLPVKDSEDDIFRKLLLRFRVFPDVYDEKKSKGLRNAARSMNPGTAVHPAHYHNYSPDS